MLVARGNICIVLFFHKNHDLSYKAVIKNVLWTFLEGSGARTHFEYQTKTSCVAYYSCGSKALRLSYKAVIKNVLWTFLEGSGARTHFEYQTKTSCVAYYSCGSKALLH